MKFFLYCYYHHSHNDHSSITILTTILSPYFVTIINTTITSLLLLLPPQLPSLRTFLSLPHHHHNFYTVTTTAWQLRVPVRRTPTWILTVREGRSSCVCYSTWSCMNTLLWSHTHCSCSLDISPNAKRFCKTSNRWVGSYKLLTLTLHITHAPLLVHNRPGLFVN